MWVLTAFGFFSIVQKPSDKKAGTLTVRARVRDDLVALKATLPSLGMISENKETDYKYRAMVSKNELAAAIADLVLGLDYPNFKDAVAKRQGAKRAETYHDVWDVLHSLQDAAPPGDATPAPPSQDATPSTKQDDATVALKAEAYGGVLINERGEVLLREPSGHYGGHAWTFSKGHPDDGETPEVTALREVLEETRGIRQHYRRHSKGVWWRHALNGLLRDGAGRNADTVFSGNGRYTMGQRGCGPRIDQTHNDKVRTRTRSGSARSGFPYLEGSQVVENCQEKSVSFV